MTYRSVRNPMMSRVFYDEMMRCVRETALLYRGHDCCDAEADGALGYDP